MIPFLAIFAGGALPTLFSHIKKGHWYRLILISMFLAAIYVISNLSLAKIDTSNEWNKMGIVLRLKKRYADAEGAFLRAKQENPINPNTYLNLSILYNAMGDQEKAKRMRAIGESFIRVDDTERLIKVMRE